MIDLFRFAQLQREAHVLADRHVRIKRVVLEHHRDVALFRVDVVDDTTADRDFAGRDVLKAGEHSEQRGLAASRWTDEHDELAIRDRDADAVQNFHVTERLAHVADVD